MLTQATARDNTAAHKNSRPKPPASVSPFAVQPSKRKTAKEATAAQSVVAAKDVESVPSKANSGLIARLLTLREQGDDFYEKFFLPGRNAMLKIMGEVYEQFYTSKSSATYADDLEVLRKKLKDFGVTLRSSSTDASLFIRMVFKDFDDKQVSIYSRSLAVAYGKGVAPEAFEKFVADTVGGFYGIVGSDGGSKGSQDNAAGNAGKVAFTDIQAEKTVETIDNFQWESDEEKCVLVAIRGMNDDSAKLKKLAVSEELFFSILAKYAAEKKALLKKTVSGDIGTTKLALQKVESLLANAQTDVDNLQADLRVAEQARNVEDVKNIRVNLLVATSRLDETVRTRKKLQSEIKGNSKQAAFA